MSVNWSSVGTTISGLTSALSSLGVSSSAMPSALQTIGSLINPNPNQSAELAICQQILIFAASQPQLIQTLAVKLATEQGIPTDAAALALTLGQPGVDIPTRVTQIEALIKSGG